MSLQHDITTHTHAHTHKRRHLLIYTHSQENISRVITTRHHDAHMSTTGRTDERVVLNTPHTYEIRATHIPQTYTTHIRHTYNTRRNTYDARTTHVRHTCDTRLTYNT